jgi:putative PEP-CTERM system TPR-repeat lipoprotein
MIIHGNKFCMQLTRTSLEIHLSPRGKTARLVTALTMVCLLGACNLISGQSAEEHLEKARTFLVDNNANAAIIEIKNALQKDANLQEGRWMLGNLYLQMGSGEAAEKELVTAKSLGYAGADLETALLKAYMLQRKFQEVVDATDTRAKAGSLDANDMTSRAEAFLGLNRLGEAESSYKEVLAKDDSSVNARLGLARIFMESDRIDEARSLIAEARTRAPQDPTVFIHEGDLEMRLNNPVAAEASYTQATSLAENNMAAQFGLIRAMLAQNKIDPATEALNRVDEIAPQNLMSKYFRALIAVRNNDPELARTNLLEVLKVLPTHAESLLMMAYLTFEQGQLEQSRDFLRTFLAQYPESAEGLKLLATIQIRLKEPEEAISNIRKIIDTSGEDPSLLSLLASATIEAGNINEGVTLLERAVELAPENSMLATQLATAYLNLGSVDKAVTLLKQAITSQADLLPPRELLVATYIRNKNYDAATSSAEELIKLKPELASSYNLLGTALNASGKAELAMAQFELALTKDPEFIPALYNLARLELVAEKTDAAEQHYRKILQIDPNHVQTLLELARIESQRGQIDKMIGLIEQARTGNPDSLGPRLLLGRHYMATGDTQKLLEIANESIKVSPDNPDVQLLLGQAQRMTGKTDDALRTLTALLGRMPDTAAVIFELAQVQLQRTDYEAARGHLQGVLKLEPEHPGALSASIELAIRQNDTELARTYTEQLKKQQPDAPDTHILIGDTFFAEGNYAEAITSYEQAYKAARTFTLTARLSQAYEKAGDIDKAQAILEEWRTANPDDVRGDLLIGGLSMRKNDKESARTHYEKVLAKAPENIVALNNLSWLYLETDIDRAYQLAEKASKAAPEDAGIMDTMGWVLVKQGKNEQGIPLIQKALAKYPESPVIRYHLAYALAATGDKVQAKSEIRKVLDTKNDFSERTAAMELAKSLE